MNACFRFRSGGAYAVPVAVFGLLLFFVASASGQGLDPIYQPTALAPQQQLAQDDTPVPAGQGAIFVPALSDGEDEPEAIVLRGNDEIASGLTGQRIVVAPGAYTVRVGSGPIQQAVEVPVQVTAGQTAMVAVGWGGLKIDVVDENNIPHRGSFELIQVSTLQPYTVGFGADTLVGERLRTLIVPPGLYRIVRPGADFRTRTDFATVFVPAGGMVHYKLVLNPITGQLRGAGIVTPQEVGVVTGASPWTRRFAIAVGVPLASTHNVVGATNQTSVGADLTFDSYVTYNRDQNYGNIVFEIEEGFLRIKPESTNALPVQKTRDRVRLDTMYTRFLNPRVGPYGRFGLLTNVFESNVLVTEDTSVVKNFLDGSQTTIPVPANGDFNIGKSFAPTLLREGAGANFRLLRGRQAFLDWRGGVGARQNRFNGAFVLTDNTTPGTVIYDQVASFNQEGLETTVVGTVTLGRLLVNTNFDLFGDFDDFGEPTVDWRNTFSWRLTGNLSVDYNIDLLRLPQVTTDAQVTQNLLFRFSWGS